VVGRWTEFALKGATAINRFYREMPRLSVDIDLVYLPNLERQKSLTLIDKPLRIWLGELEKGVRPYPT